MINMMNPSYDLGLHCFYCYKRLISASTPLDQAPYFVGDPATGTGVLAEAYGIITFDHKLPKSKGGTNSRENLVPCCSRCNTLKLSQDFDRYYTATAAVRIERQVKEALATLRAYAAVDLNAFLIVGGVQHER